LAGSAAGLAADTGEEGLGQLARAQFKQAKEASLGIPWLVGLARQAGHSLSAESVSPQAALMLQVEQLEAQLVKLGTVHNRAFSAREKLIRDGLKTGEGFEQAQLQLGEHLGFNAGKREEDGSPDPWWIVGDLAIVFEDHANAGQNSYIDTTKARQAASHPDWLKVHVPDAASASIVSVLVTPSTRAAVGAVPSLSRVSYWGLGDFRDWAEHALTVVRDLRKTFQEPGDLAWRADAATALAKVRADAPGLHKWLSGRTANDYLSVGH